MKLYRYLFLIIVLLFGVNFIKAQNGVLLNSAQTQRPVIKSISEAEYKAIADGWLIDVNEAYEISKKTGKPIMANFTGSDWCGWCIKLKREVFSKKEFKEWAKENVVLLFVDFPRRVQLPKKYQDQNAGLQSAFQVTGFPTIWVFNLGKNADGQFTIDAYGKTGYVAGGPSKFQEGVDQMIKKKKDGKL